MQRFSDLRVWQSARSLSVTVYKATRTLPFDERFGLSTQLRRAAISVLANIAEGAKRTHRADYAHFLNIAEGSLAELQCLLILCDDLGYLCGDQQALQIESKRTAVMLDSLRRAVLRASKAHRQ